MKPELVISENGTQTWRLNGEPHRLDGPAVIHIVGGESWWVYGQLHRLDGPAVTTREGRLLWSVDSVMLSR